MQIRSFIIAYALVLAILLFADRRPHAAPPDHYSHVVDLTNGRDALPSASRTRIIAPGALIPGTWSAAQIPPERLVAPLVVMDLSTAHSPGPQISFDDIAAWETQHGMIPAGAVVAIRYAGSLKLAETRLAETKTKLPAQPLPVAGDAAEFLVNARDTIGFAVQNAVSFSSDRSLARQLALHGSYVLEAATRFDALPATGSLIIVAPALDPTPAVDQKKNKHAGEVPVRVLAMVH